MKSQDMQSLQDNGKFMDRGSLIIAGLLSLRSRSPMMAGSRCLPTELIYRRIPGSELQFIQWYLRPNVPVHM